MVSLPEKLNEQSLINHAVLAPLELSTELPDEILLQLLNCETSSSVLQEEEVTRGIPIKTVTNPATISYSVNTDVFNPSMLRVMS